MNEKEAGVGPFLKKKKKKQFGMVNDYVFIRGQTSAFLLFLFFSSHMFKESTVDVSKIRTRMVKVEDDTIPPPLRLKLSNALSDLPS